MKDWKIRFHFIFSVFRQTIFTKKMNQYPNVKKSKTINLFQSIHSHLNEIKKMIEKSKLMKVSTSLRLNSTQFIYYFMYENKTKSKAIKTAFYVIFACIFNNYVTLHDLLSFIILLFIFHYKRLKLYDFLNSNKINLNYLFH